MNERRIARIEQLIRQRVAEVLANDLHDPRKGMITVTRVKVDRELEHAKVYWSVLGGDSERSRNQHMLDSAAGYVQREVAKVLSTRTVPRIRFLFDESIAGAHRIDQILGQIRAERGEGPLEGTGDDGDDPTTDDPATPDARG